MPNPLLSLTSTNDVLMLMVINIPKSNCLKSSSDIENI